MIYGIELVHGPVCFNCSSNLCLDLFEGELHKALTLVYGRSIKKSCSNIQNILTSKLENIDVNPKCLIQ